MTNTTAPEVESLTRINVRPVGSSLPLGLFAFGTAMFVMAAFSAHWIPQHDQHALAIVVLAFAVPLQLIALVFALLSRDTLGASIMGVFGANWLVTGLVLLASPPGSTSDALAFFWFAIALITLLIGSAAVASKPYLSTILFVATLRFAAGALHELGIWTAIPVIDTILGLVLAALSAYGALALLFEESRPHTLLPLFRKGQARRALQGGLDDQLATLVHEPGVRTQL